MQNFEIVINFMKNTSFFFFVFTTVLHEYERSMCSARLYHHLNNQVCKIYLSYKI